MGLSESPQHIAANIVATQPTNSRTTEAFLWRLCRHVASTRAGSKATTSGVWLIALAFCLSARQTDKDLGIAFGNFSFSGGSSFSQCLLTTDCFWEWTRWRWSWHYGRVILAVVKFVFCFYLLQSADSPMWVLFKDNLLPSLKMF